jgi:hypothetical protein
VLSGGHGITARQEVPISAGPDIDQLYEQQIKLGSRRAVGLQLLARIADDVADEG